MDRSFLPETFKSRAQSLSDTFLKPWNPRTQRLFKIIETPALCAVPPAPRNKCPVDVQISTSLLRHVSLSRIMSHETPSSSCSSCLSRSSVIIDITFLSKHRKLIYSGFSPRCAGIGASTLPSQMLPGGVPTARSLFHIFVTKFVVRRICLQKI